MEALGSLHSELTGQGIVFALARVRAELRDQSGALGLAEKIGEERIFPALPTAVEADRDWVGQHR